VIIGGAFGKIVTSFVNDVLMPPLGVLLGGVDFKDYKATLVDAVGDKAAVTLNYGMFLQNVIDFLIIAFAIFIAIKAMNAAKKKEVPAPAAPPAPTAQEKLLGEIRDLLREKK
jgi:large conductance mechanosensitive channel